MTSDPPSVQVWLVHCDRLSAPVGAALLDMGVSVSMETVAPAAAAVVLVACGFEGDASAVCPEPFVGFPDAAHIALLPAATPDVAAMAFAAGADDYVVLGDEPAGAAADVAHHVQLVLSRRGAAGATAPPDLPLLPDPVIATPATPDITDAGATGLSCVVTTRGRMVRWSNSMGAFVRAARDGASFFELMHSSERPTLRNAALLLMAGEPAVDVTARLIGAQRALRWHLVMHPRGDRFLATATPLPVPDH